MLLVLMVVSLIVAYATAPGKGSAKDAAACGIDPTVVVPETPKPQRPGEWLEYSPFLIIVLVVLARDLIGFTFVQLLVHIPVVLLLL